ncbi:MAG: hypothetical protein N5P05_002239 [Chroococcopsis gigantea SAG 12.99]|jgi:hypothetical protein|nr:hypothetical protein [Chroococcopsis gigantea SAG 12.99]
MFSLLLDLIISFMGGLNPTINLSAPPVQRQLVAQAAPANPADYQRFKQVIERIRSQQLSSQPMGEIMQAIATNFLGSSYKAGLLDKSQKEELFISLNQFDCVLFVETVLALSRNMASGQYQYQDLARQITNLRYRDGKIDGYCSRLHYFSDWIDDNQKRGNVKNITARLGGIKLNKKLNFMSGHRQVYSQLKNNDINYECIKTVENNLDRLELTYIPTAKIKSIYNYLQPGDIIGVVTAIPGLDTTHTGLIYSQGNQRGLIHASPAGSVTIAPDLQNYIKNVDRAIGIFVVRPLSPAVPN